MTDDEPDEISVLDYFAAAAMNGMVSSISNEFAYVRMQAIAGAGGMKTSEWIARDAYMQAEAMMVERSKRRAATTTNEEQQKP